MFSLHFVHSRYRDGERLTDEDEKAVVENLLVYHPHSEDKIGCGIDCIMVSQVPCRLQVNIQNLDVCSLLLFLTKEVTRRSQAEV